MAVSTTPPLLTPLPPAPLPTDAEAVFDAKAGASLTAQADMVAEVNTSLTWQAGATADTKGYKEAAATSAGSAASSATASASSATSSAGSATASATSANSAQVSAAAAGSAAGLPSLVGNGGKALVAKLDETGVEFKSVGQQVGDMLVTASAPGATYLPTNTVYLQSSYPELFAKLGVLPNISSTAAAAGALPAGCSSVAFGNGVFVAMPSTGEASSTAYTSPDGITWTARTLPASSYWFDVTYGGGLFVAIGQSSISIATSPDGVTWTSRTAPGGIGNPISVSYGNGRFVVGPISSAVGMTSTDGITWTATTFPTTGYWYGIAYGNGVFVAGNTQGGAFATSVNGTTWTTRTSPNGLGSLYIVFGNGKFVATNNSGVVFTSIDGISWTYKALGTPAVPYLGKVAFGSGIFIIISGSSDSNFCWVSLDGNNWTTKALPRSVTWSGVACGSDKFVAVATTPVSASLPLLSYDKTTQFTTPEVIPVLGVTAYIKAKVA